MNDDKWTELIVSLPIGTTVLGIVDQLYPFGFFVQLDAHPNIRAIVEINNYRPSGVAVTASEFPRPGSPVSAIVVGHADKDHQIRLRIAPDTPNT
jgi:ribosomal protein S1